jgi:hypothetical protein
MQEYLRRCGTLLTACALSGWAAPALAQAVTWAELQGAVIESASRYTIRILRDGIERSTMSRGSWKINVGPGQSISGTLTRETRGGIKTDSGTFTLGRPQKFADGDTVWFFENGSLVNLRTFQAGGIKVTYTFTRRAGGLACSVHAPWVRESGEATISRDAVGGIGNVQVLGAKQESSSCSVSRR